MPEWAARQLLHPEERRGREGWKGEGGREAAGRREGEREGGREGGSAAGSSRRGRGRPRGSGERRTPALPGRGGPRGGGAAGALLAE